MSKYAKYSIWLAKAIIAIAAAIAFVKFFMTGDVVYAAMFAADVAVFITALPLLQKWRKPNNRF